MLLEGRVFQYNEEKELTDMKTLYYNATVYTTEGFAEAFIVEDGRFVFCGSNEQGKQLITEHDEAVDLQGRFVCPGFNDSHMHLLNFGQSLLLARLNEHTDSLKGMLEYLVDFRKENRIEGESWLRGRGWNQDCFRDESRMPTRWDIDEVISDIPVMLTRACGHCAVVNSRALEICGIGDDAAGVAGGSIGRDTDGKLNGLFFDNAISLVSDAIPAPKEDEIARMIMAGSRKLNSYGITSSQSDDYGVFHSVNWRVINQVYRHLAESGQLTVRVSQQANFTDYDEYVRSVQEGNVTGQGDELYRIGPLKMVGDGSLGGKTAWLSRPYADDPSTCGFPLYSNEHVRKMIEYANDHNMQVAVHAIGDACLDQVLDAIELALQKSPRSDHRHGIVHCQISRADQLERISRLKLHVYAQSVFLDYDNHIVGERAGQKLASTSYSWKTLLDNGVTVSNGSDAPVELPDVLKGIECAVTRTSLDGTGPYLPDQAFTVKQAIDSFTVAGAKASFEEAVKGAIAEGQYADFVILEKDPFKIRPQDIHQIKVLKTCLGGKEVYSAE